MPISLGSHAFPDGTVAAKERYEEVGGRHERRVVLEGIVTGNTIAAIETELDAIVQLASTTKAETALSLRPGRRLLVRRIRFVREVLAERLAGSFELELTAPNPLEEAETEQEVEWPISASGAAIPLATQGNAPVPLVIGIEAVGAIVNPSFSDGIRQLTYSGEVPDGAVLLIDGEERKVTLDEADVTPYTSGLFPVLTPPGGTLTYTDHASSSHAADALVFYRDRWW